MGIDLFDLLIQEPDLIPLLNRFAEEIGVEIRPQLLSVDKTPAEILRQTSVRKDRDYVLILDPDEYLFLPSHANLASFLEANQFPTSCYMRWIVTPSDFHPHHRQLGYLGHIGKHLAASQAIVGMATAHTFSLAGSPEISPFQFDRHDGLIIHYWGRTFNDTLLKCLYYRGVHKSKQSSVAEVKSCCHASLLPGRLKLLAALNLHQRYIPTPDYLNTDIDLDLEDQLLRVHLDTGEIEQVESAYMEYKQFLAGPENIAARSAIQAYPGCHSIQKLAEVLPSLPAAANPE